MSSFYYYDELDIPPLTLEDTPVVLKVKLQRGLLKFVDIGIPSWVSRLAKCRLYINSVQVVPIQRDKWFTGDNITQRIPMDFSLDQPEYEIEIRGYNEDDTYRHQLSFGFSLEIVEEISSSLVTQFTSLGQVVESEE